MCHPQCNVAATIEIEWQFYWHATSWPVNAARRYNISAVRQRNENVPHFGDAFLHFHFMFFSLSFLLWQCLWHVRAVLVISALFGQRKTRGGAWTCIILIKRASFCRCRRCHDENIIKVYDIYLLPTLNDTCVSLSERLKLSDSHPCSLPPSPPPFSLSHCGH